MTTAYRANRYNQIVEVEFRAGWIGLLSGENQTKALNRALDELNAHGVRVAAMVIDRWSIWRRLLWLLIFIITLGFVGRVPNILIVTEPIDRGTTPLEPAPLASTMAIEATAPATPPAVRPAKESNVPRRLPATKKTAKKAAPRKRAT